VRNAFASEILGLAEKNDRLFLLSGDIGNRLFNPYKERFPDRFINCGVAEANMMSVAAGMALAGMRPVVYTIAPFATTRCLEQIKIDVCYQELPVVIVGVGAGLSYASLGPTHHTLEDLAILRTLPHMTIVCPGDSWEVRASLRAALSWEGPVYLRLGKKGEPEVHADIPHKFAIGKGFPLRKGQGDVCLLSAGNTLPLAMEVGDILERKGASPTVVSFHTVKPLDDSLLENAFASHSLVVTLEEHSRIGGLGGAVAEWLADQSDTKARLLRLGIEDLFCPWAGNQEILRSRLGLTAETMAESILSQFSRGKH